ncbi:hypothetical protein QFZ66_001375 [Streptomyces sp. B4I13]|uniref:Uncharacterized protein n=1 Tax=Streptomyces achromogenes TaxID=67255 RepID=A0ABU0QAR5_STRAH|nr:hypothetical protein [Streptomyces achromogenes]MDQ0834906.1 hypothetical protein [Streptomyces achromogenes]MDQ0957497.1 hypothetical protein [Streptomyces sp. B4I13]
MAAPAWSGFPHTTVGRATLDRNPHEAGRLTWSC